MKTALRWGLYIGLANLVWLYLAFYLGLHTSGIGVFQVFMLGWFLLTLTGFILALRAVKRENPALSYWGGLAAGAVAAAVSAVVAVAMQIGYYTAIHPEWPEYMAGQTRQHFTAEGMPAAEVETMVEQARGTFSLGSYAIASAATALVTGVVLSAIMLFLRGRPANASADVGEGRGVLSVSAFVVGTVRAAPDGTRQADVRRARP